jgi:hypothetical protein
LGTRSEGEEQERRYCCQYFLNFHGCILRLGFNTFRSDRVYLAISQYLTEPHKKFSIELIARPMRVITIIETVPIRLPIGFSSFSYIKMLWNNRMTAWIVMFAPQNRQRETAKQRRTLSHQQGHESRVYLIVPRGGTVTVTSDDGFDVKTGQPMLPECWAWQRRAAKPTQTKSQQQQARASTVPPTSPNWLTTFGASGVDIFFVISGFIMIHASFPRGRASLSPVAFATRRILRIYPFYWFCLFATELRICYVGPAAQRGPHVSPPWGCIHLRRLVTGPVKRRGP